MKFRLLSRAIVAATIFCFSTLSASSQTTVATPIKAGIGQTVQLDPTDGFIASNDTALRAEWTWLDRPATSVIAFSDPSALRPTITPDLAGNFRAQLALFPAADLTATVPLYTVEVEISTENLTPVALIVARGLPGDQRDLILDGSQSYDVDGDSLTYSWGAIDVPEGGSVTFGSVTAPLTSVQVAGTGTFNVGLTVQDAFGNTSVVAAYEIVNLAGQGTQACSPSDGIVLANDGSQNVLFPLGDVTNGVVRNYIIRSFDTDRGGEQSFDTLTFSYLNVDYTLTTVQEFLTFTDFLEHDGDNTSDAIISRDSSEKYLCFTFGEGRGSVLLESVVDNDLTRSNLLNRSADFPEVQDYYLESFDVTLPNDGSQRVTFDLGDVSNGPAVDYLIPSFDTNRGSEQSFDTLKFIFNGQQYALSHVNDFKSFTDFIEHDGDQETDALISANSSVRDLTFTFGEGRSSVTLKNILDNDLRRGALINRSVDFYEVPPMMSSVESRQVGPVSASLLSGVSAEVSQTVVLDAFKSTDVDGDVLTSGAALLIAPSTSVATLNVDATGRTQVTPDVDGDYLVALSVSDGQLNGSDQVLVSTIGNTRPVAKINRLGAVQIGDAVTLNGRQSFDFDGDFLGYSWALLSKPTSSAATLLGSDKPTSEFTADVAGTYIAQLQVSDEVSASVPQTVVIVVGNTVPIAVAGPDLAADENGNAVLDGSLSIAASPSYAWTIAGLTSSALPTLSNESGAIAGLALQSDGNGDFAPAIAQLVVADVNGISLPQTVFVGGGNVRPVVRAGADITTAGGIARVVQGATYGFDANGDALEYTWAIVARPEGSAVAIDPAQPTNKLLVADQLSFTPDVAGVYLIQLGASDGSLLAEPSVITIIVENTAPTAVVGGDLTAFVGEGVALDGTGSFDPESNALTYAWTLSSAPTGSLSVIQNASDPLAGFTADKRGTYTFSLVVSDFALSSAPATLALTVPNRDPIASLNAPSAGETGIAQTLDASASSDPDGDILTIGLVVTSAPSGASPSVIETSAGVFSFTGDLAGDYIVELTVSDGDIVVVQSATIALTTPNRPPVLSGINPNYAIEAGLAFALNLNANDPDGDPLTFFATQLPLPTGFEFNATTGEIRFRPEAAQIGDYVIEVGVSDGTRTDTDVLNLSVLAATATDTSVFGQVLDAVDFANGIETPVVGVDVALQTAGLLATTDASGEFSFGNLTAGRETLVIDPSAVGGYLALQSSITVTENQDRDLAPAFLLTPLNEGCALVVAGQETTLIGSQTGLTVNIAADTILDSLGAPYSGEVCLGSLPQQTSTPALPDDTLACQIYGLSAPGATFTSGVGVTGPNYDNLPEATELELWQTSASGAFRPTSVASVDLGSVTVSAANAPLADSVLFTFLPQAPRAQASDDQPVGNRQLTAFEGDLNEVYTLPGYFAFNQQQQVGLSYHSATADPTIIVAGDVSIADTASLPVVLSSRIDVGGLSLSSDAVWTPREAADGTIPAVLGEEVTMRQSMPVDASGLPSGRYTYDFVTRAAYDCSTVASRFDAEFYVQSTSNSPYGPGWAIDDLQTLVQNDDGTVAIIDDDSVVTFDPEPTFSSFSAEAFVEEAEGVIGVETADFDGNGLVDIAFSEAAFGRTVILLNQGNRQFDRLNGPSIAEAVDVPVSGDFNAAITSIRAVDFDLNGIPDLTYLDQKLNVFAPLINDGFASFDKGSELAASAVTQSIADLDGDGFLDILIPNDTSGVLFKPRFYFGNGTDYDVINPGGFFGEGTLDGPILQEIVIDMDGDGLLDIVYRSKTGLDIYYNNGNRLFEFVEFELGASPELRSGSLAAAGDLNGDGLPDLINSDDARLEVFFNTGGRTFGPSTEIVRPANASNAGNINLIDVDADGILDLIYSGTSQSLDGSLAVYTGQADGTFLPPEVGLINHPIASSAVLDLDGDGSLDLISTQRFSLTVDFSDPTAGGNLAAGSGEFSTLIALDGGGWERRYKDGMKVIFDANGLQTAIVDQQGNTTEFAYGPDGRLVSKTDQVGGATSFTYDANGRLETVTYPDGRVTAFEYDDQDGLRAVTEPTGSTIQFQYDENNRLVSMTNQNGNTSTYNYDATGRMTGATLPDGSSISNQVASSLGLVGGLGNELPNPLKYVAPEDRVTTITDRKGEITEIIVNAFGAPLQITDPLGRVTKMERDGNNLVVRVERPSDATSDGTRIDEVAYDNRANVTQMIEAVGTPFERTMLYTYEPVFNNVTEMTDADGFVSQYEYDAFGEATRMIDPEGGEMLYAYTPEGKILSETDKNGNLTTYAYDAQQNLGAMTYADGSVTQMTYDTSGNTTAVAEAAGTPIERIVQRTYDDLNRVLTVEITGADGAQIDGLTTYTYKPAGNLATVTDETGLVTSMNYDGLERLVRVDDPAEGLIQRAYNEAGEVIQHINGDGEVHIYDYDAISRLTQTIDPEGFIKSFGYDVRDNIDSVTDGRGGQTTFVFDPLDRMTERTNPINQTMVRAYDLRDNLNTLTREDGLVETATYDGLNRRTQVITPDNTLTYAYDAHSNLIEAADDDSRVTFTYDERNRLATTTTDGSVGPQPEVTISYTYDQLDRRTSMSDSLGGTTTYAYDAEDRLTDLTAPWGTVYNFGYDGEGRRTSLTSTSGRDTRYEYTNGLLTALRHTQSGVALTDLTYQYGVDAQLEAIVDALDPNKSKVIAYDNLNRLIQVAEGAPGDVALPVEDYAYDEEGNRTASHLSALYASNAHNQLLEDEDYTYAYDARGNRVSRTAKADGAVETYTYDSQNRLVGYVSPTTTASYVYDALDRRVSKAVDGTTTAFIYDRWSPDATKNEVSLDFSEGKLARRWLFGSRVDEPLEVEAYSDSTTPDSGTIRLMLEDRIGSIVRIVSPTSGTAVAPLDYDAFGQLLGAPALADTSLEYRFIGREYDIESDLYFLRARHYDAKAGQFLQSDPVGFHSTDLNIYSYVENDPINFVDPSGLFLNGVEQRQLEAQAAGTAVISTQKVAIGVTQLAAMVGLELWSFCEIYGAGYAGCFGQGAEKTPETQTASDGRGGSITGPQVTPPSSCGNVSVHGNSRASDLFTVLYALYDADGMFLKYGITSMDPPSSRYPKALRDGMIILDGGCRSDMLDKERELVSSNGGPWNFEPWSRYSR